MEKKIEFISNQFESLSFSERVNLYNEYCSEERPDDYIYSNDEEFFDTYFSGAMDAVRAVCFGDYHFSDEYVWFNGYGNLESSDFPELYTDDSFFEWLVDNHSELLDDFEEDEETDSEE